jgi:6-phosphofructokinase 1
LIIVAEGLKNANGEELFDESAGVDAFGHKRLAGAGKYVCAELTKRFKGDPKVARFMKDEKMFVKGLYETPEVRSVSPGHLVRCGHSSVYDANFGKEAGAAAVTLLREGKSGVTVSGVNNGTIEYINTPDAIKQRFVDPDTIAMHEYLGLCFGRKPQKITLRSRQKKDQVERFL